MQEFHDRWLVHQELYYRVAFMILGDREEAMDMVQNLYLKLWNSRNSLDSVKSPEAYGVSLLRNICIDFLRHKNLHPPASLDEISCMASSSTSDGKMVANESMDALKKAMAKMSEKQREVVKLRYFEGLEYDEIQNRTGLGAVNIRVMLSRARSIIKKTIDDEK